VVSEVDEFELARRTAEGGCPHMIGYAFEDLLRPGQDSYILRIFIQR